MPDDPQIDYSLMPLFDFVGDVAAKKAAPGGGAVAAVTGALAAALAAMACAFTQGKKRFAAAEPAIVAALETLHGRIARLRTLMDADAAAFTALGPFLKLTPQERAGRPDVRAAVERAIAIPWEVGQIASALLEQMIELAPITNPLLISDLGIAGALAHATVTASRLNVQVNLPLLDDPARVGQWRGKIVELTQSADSLWEQVRRAVDRYLA